MCIQVVFSFSTNGKKYTVVLNQRDADISSKDLPFGSHNDLIHKYAAERAARGLPQASDNDGDVHGLFSDSPYANGQMAIGNGRIALLTDYRLHNDDPRRKSGLKWGQKRGASAEIYARSGAITAEYANHEHPHMMIFVDRDGFCDKYEFDGAILSYSVKASGTPDDPVIGQTCGSEVPNFRASWMTRLASKLVDSWDGTTSIEEFAARLVHEVLGDTTKPNPGPAAGDVLLSLGKDDRYERHVESVRIEPVASWINEEKPLAWMTVASVACIVDHSSSRVHVASCTYRKPKTGAEAAECALEVAPISVSSFDW